MNEVNDIIKKHINNPSIKNIKENFSFRPVTTDEVKKVITGLKTNKSLVGEIPIQILKESEFTFECLKNFINHSTEETGIFPSSLKLENITPIFKKDDPLDKSKYRSVSILALLRKVYERIIYNHLSQHSEQFLNSILCDFHIAHSTQNALFKLIHSWQKEFDSGGFVGTILMDLIKAYYCISHEILIAKLECYGLDKISLKLILNYLSHRKQRTKIGSSSSSWFDIYIGVPQGSILGPLLFNIFINGFLLNVVIPEVCNFVDDNTSYSFDKKLDPIFLNLKYDPKNVLSCFQVKSLKANSSKFQFMILGAKQNTSFVLNINGNKLTTPERLNCFQLSLIIN